MGLLLVLIPWSVFWEHNYFAEALPMLQTALSNNYLRGAVSGLGIVNVGVGLAELGSVLSHVVASRGRALAPENDDGRGRPGTFDREHVAPNQTGLVD